MTGKIKMAICFGGKSTEHEVSIKSALNILQKIDFSKYDISFFYFNKEGKPEGYDKTKEKIISLIKNNGKKIFGIDSDDLSEITEKAVNTIFGKPEESRMVTDSAAVQVNTSCDGDKLNNPKHMDYLTGGYYDVIFPVFHGINGEDGTVQGMFEFTGIPYTGCGHQSSAICIDKDITKRICKSANIRITDWLMVHKHEWENDSEKKAEILKKVRESFAGKAYIKPARLGSSIGVYPVNGEQELLEKAAEAFAYDRKVIIEEMLTKPREITIGVMGLPDEMVLSETGEFNYASEESYFNYNAKYGTGSRDGIIPAPVNNKIKKELVETTQKLFRLFELDGFARVDFFLCGTTLYFNEINTIPAMDINGTFMRMWEKSGLSYGGFVDKVVDYAFKRHKRMEDN